MSNKKILILGSRGTLGQALVKEFTNVGFYDVTSWDRDDIDVTDEAQLKEKIGLLRPEIIINTVAHNAVDKIETEEAEFLSAQKINGEAVKNLSLIAKELGAVLVHYSSDYVFAGVKEEGYAEEDSLEPINKYGQTKLMGEKYLLENASQFYLIRLSKLFSDTKAGSTSKKSFVETMLSLYDQGKRDFDLVDDELSSPTYAPDLAKFTRALIEDKKPWGIYHGANSGGCTWYELGKAVFEIKKYDVCSVPVPSVKFPRPTKLPHTSILLNTKMPPQRPWQEALKEALQYLN
ncbi:MAG: SDR family oxidoreductase [Candidatus Magasanikbacteria bacterium]|nr:SDR family oxidoreductase [Candidatus Magasanikbacteria bacterium]